MLVGIRFDDEPVIREGELMCHNGDQVTVEFGDGVATFADHRLVTGAELDDWRDGEDRAYIDKCVARLRDFYPAVVVRPPPWSTDELERPHDMGHVSEVRIDTARFKGICDRADLVAALCDQVVELLRVLARYVPEGEVERDVARVRRLFP